MSHFTKIQTKLKDRPALLEALNLLGHFLKRKRNLRLVGIMVKDMRLLLLT